MNELGAPWRYGNDQPATLVEGRGWRAAPVDPARIGTEWGRWPAPPEPSGPRSPPLGALVEATKG
ncbi:hypothetical protein [Vitiosangium sp. GDMCC 1.1324]|uniref:hypothetical protein n=1 Tax=Vitiosangium sp. (strain GDMCC 1.1324) TaxID=2138576 RepID=UPI0011B5AE74|nr:hypothetical protein [Vitiosangium sp. GDMCC 1.1324]